MQHYILIKPKITEYTYPKRYPISLLTLDGKMAHMFHVLFGEFEERLKKVK